MLPRLELESTIMIREPTRTGRPSRRTAAPAPPPLPPDV